MPGRSFHVFKTLKHKPFTQPTRLSSSIPLPTDDNQSSLIHSSLTYAQRASLRDLSSALSGNASPLSVWAHYNNALSSLGSQSLPLNYHRRVLRRCTLPKKVLKDRVVRHLASERRVFDPQYKPPPFQSRLQTLINNIWSLGVRPALEDYNYILARFADVGYYEGCFQVYEEVKRVGHTPNYITFGHCLQAMAYRLTLPISESSRETMIDGMQRLFRDFMADMRKYRVPMTSVHLDLTIRILKETLDYEGLDAILRWGYGIDLSNPDRVALEYSDPSSSKAKGPFSKPPSPFPLTTTALNTIIDMLGRLGNISKLVQAFEVLTQPLPQASQHFFNSFETDEDDDYGVSVDVTSPSRIQPAYTSPNTTTYSLLIRYLCQHGHAILARHYLQQARMMHFVTAHKLHTAVLGHVSKNIPLYEIPAPRFSINRLILLPVLGESNRDKNLGLMKWLSSKVPSFIDKQKRDYLYYKSLAESLGLTDKGPAHEPPPPATPPDVSDLDVTDLKPPEAPKVKYFDINLHIKILRQNIVELEAFNDRLDFVLGRTTQRVKERLSRRVWDTKDIYLATEANRVLVPKERWVDMVKYQPRKTDDVPPSRHRKVLRAFWRRLSSPRGTSGR